MPEFFQEMPALQKVYTLSASIGGLLFLIRLLLQFMGSDDGSDLDPIDGETGLSDSDLSFKILSFQGITAFLMMFGLAGLALVIESKVGGSLSLLGASLAGFISVWIIGKIFSLSGRLVSSGTIDMNNAVGEEGQVYLNIPASGIGKVTIVIQNHQKTFDAVAEKKGEIKTGERVIVTRIVSGNTLVVDRV